MNNQEILNRLNITDYIIKPKRGKVKDIWLSEFILAILNNKSGIDVAKSFGFSEQTFNRLVRKIFETKLEGSQTWKYYIHELAKVYFCYSCETCKEYSEFHKDSSRRIGYTCICKVCKSEANKTDYQKQYSKQHYQNNKEYYKAKSSINRQRLKDRTPAWADLNKISEFYIRCPIGYHVDHIIPLNGKIVSGLHVENNLQYLLEKDNLSKSNKYEVE